MKLDTCRMRAFQRDSTLLKKQRRNKLPEDTRAKARTWLRQDGRFEEFAQIVQPAKDLLTHVFA